MKNDEMLMQHQQTLEDIELAQKFRTTKGTELLDLLGTTNLTNVIRIGKLFWYFSDADLHRAKVEVKIKIDELIEKVKITI